MLDNTGHLLVSGHSSYFPQEPVFIIMYDILSFFPRSLYIMCFTSGDPISAVRLFIDNMYNTSYIYSIPTKVDFCTV
jgi:hypothetical protein